VQSLTSCDCRTEHACVIDLSRNCTLTKKAEKSSTNPETIRDGLCGGRGLRGREGPTAAAGIPEVEEPRVRGGGCVGAYAEREGELQLVGLLSLLRPALAGRPRPRGGGGDGRGGLEVEGVVAGGGDRAAGAVAAAAELALEGVGGGVVRGGLGEEGVGAVAGGAGGKVHGRREVVGKVVGNFGGEGRNWQGIGWAWLGLKPDPRRRRRQQERDVCL
jgi:hypothetical protein